MDRQDVPAIDGDMQMALTSNDKHMHVLVTGATGFVGRATCDVLLAKGLLVRAAVRKPSSDLPSGVEQVVVSRIAHDTSWHQALEGIDIVIHLAARVHVMKDEAHDPLAEFCEVNESGTRNLAIQAAQSSNMRFVYISSIKVNGEKTHVDRAFTELDVPAPRDAYGISKLRAEQALRLIEQETGMPVTIIRPPLIYGPGVRANFLALLGLVYKSLPLPLGQVQNLRSMVYLGNLVDAILHCTIDPRAAGKTFLVADGQDVSTPDLIRKLASSMRRPCRLWSAPVLMLRAIAALVGRSASIDRLTQSLRVDSSNIREQLQWHPPYTLDQGLHETVEWYVSRVKAC
jgi:nucleoside-diphosphate-sugar epimerase